MDINIFEKNISTGVFVVTKAIKETNCRDTWGKRSGGTIISILNIKFQKDMSLVLFIIILYTFFKLTMRYKSK